MAKSIIQQNVRTGFASTKYFIPNAVELAECLCETNTKPTNSRPTEQSINLGRTFLDSITEGDSFVISPRQFLLCAGLDEKLLDSFLDEAKLWVKDIRRAQQAN